MICATICLAKLASRHLSGCQVGTLKGEHTSEAHRSGRFLIGAMVLSDVITACGSQSETAVTMRPAVEQSPWLLGYPGGHESE